MDFTTFEIPSGLVSDQSIAWISGFFTAAAVRITRAGIRWFKRAGTDNNMAD